MIRRLAEGEDTVIFARFDEAEKCEFIKANAPEEAWSSTDDGAGLLIKASALREQAREMLVSAVRYTEPPHSRSQSWALTAPQPHLSPARVLYAALPPKSPPAASGPTDTLAATAAAGPALLPHSNSADVTCASNAFSPPTP